jgi:hypothetical protein
MAPGNFILNRAFLPVASGRYRSLAEVRAALAFWNARTLLGENAIATL